jgi:dienelactone hydrolase
MGGALSAVAAIKVHEISAAVVFYGTPNPQLADATTCHKPVQAHFGELDGMKGFSAPEVCFLIGSLFLSAFAILL